MHNFKEKVIWLLYITVISFVSGMLMAFVLQEPWGDRSEVCELNSNDDKNLISDTLRYKSIRSCTLKDYESIIDHYGYYGSDDVRALALSIYMSNKFNDVTASLNVFKEIIETEMSCRAGSISSYYDLLLKMDDDSSSIASYYLSLTLKNGDTAVVARRDDFIEKFLVVNCLSEELNDKIFN